MPKRTKSYAAWLDAELSDPATAAAYLNSAREDSTAMFFKALRKVSVAQSRQMTELAETVGVSRESLYRMMSETGNPSHESVSGILSAMGFRIDIVPIVAENSGGREGGLNHGERLAKQADTPSLKGFSFGSLCGIAERVTAYWSGTLHPSGNQTAHLITYASATGRNFTYAPDNAISGNTASACDLPDMSFVLAQQASQGKFEQTRE